MPLQKGHSPEVVSSNIKELVKAGHPQKQAIAIALASKRKFKKMASGGLADDEYAGSDFDSSGTPQPVDSGDEDAMLVHKPAGGSKLDYRGDEPMHDDEQRSLNEIREDGEYYPSEVENPMEQEEAKGFAAALRREAMSSLSPENYAYGGNVENKKSAKVPAGDRFDKPEVVKGMDPATENFALGGLVDDPGRIHDELGSKPEEDMTDGVEDAGASLRSGEADLDHSVRNDYVVGSPKPPRDLGISQEAMEAIRQKRMKRRYPIV